MLRMQRREWTSSSELHPSSGRLWSLLVHTEPSRGGSHLTQLSYGPQMGSQKLWLCCTVYRREMWRMLWSGASLLFFFSFFFLDWITVCSFQQQGVHIFSSDSTTRHQSRQTQRKQNNPTHFSFTSQSVSHKSSLPVTQQKTLKTLYCKLLNHWQTQGRMKIKWILMQIKKKESSILKTVCFYDDEAQRRGTFKM